MYYIGRFILKYRLILMILIAIITVIALRFVPKLKLEDDESTWFSRSDPILKIYDDFKTYFEGSDLIVVAYELPQPFTEDNIPYLTELTARLARLPYVEETVSLTTVEDIVGTEAGLEIEPLIGGNDINVSDLYRRIERHPLIFGNLISTDFRTVAILLNQQNLDRHDKPLGEMTQELNRALKILLKNEKQRTGYRYVFGGEMITDGEISLMMEHDMSVFFPLSMLLSGIILFLIFRNLASVLIPLLTVLIALIWILGLKGALDSPITPVSTTLFALITIIGLANSIHLISHFRLEFRRSGLHKEAILKSYQKAGRPCLFTSLTTAVGFGSLLVSSIPAIHNLGAFAAVGILCAFILSLILLPLATYGFNTRKTARRTINTQLLLNSIGNYNVSHWRTILVISLATIILLLLGIPRIEIEASIIEYLKPSTQLYQHVKYLDQHLMGVSNTEIVIRGKEGDFKNPETLQKIEALQEIAAAHPRVAVTYSMVDYLKLIYRALNEDAKDFYRIPDSREAIAQSLLLYEISGGEELENYVTLEYDVARISIISKQMNNEERKALLNDIRHSLKDQFRNFHYDITGIEYLIDELTNQIILTQINSLRTAFVIILIIMLIFFGIRGGLVSIVPNIFPIIFVLGLMGWLHFRLNMATAIIASIAIGIVVDDTIHFFTHFRYALESERDPVAAMQAALLSVGQALIFSSAVLIIGFLIFLLSKTTILVDFGILASVAIFTALTGDLCVGPILLIKFPVFPRRRK